MPSSFRNWSSRLRFLPPAAHQPCLFQIMQYRIDAPFAEGESVLGPLLDRLHDFVAVHLPLGQQPEDDQFRNAIEEIRVRLFHSDIALNTFQFKVCQGQITVHGLESDPKHRNVCPPVQGSWKASTMPKSCLRP